jgi:ABC-type Mn2+/Zn2+ transport system permease subunit
VNPASGNFLKDILSDATGVTLHRFQMLVWTVVLGIVFALQVYRNLAMMDFSPELLALQGISGGTYLGFKVPEAPASSGAPAT